jgi:hypothetical protein
VFVRVTGLVRTPAADGWVSRDAGGQAQPAAGRPHVPVGLPLLAEYLKQMEKVYGK